MANSSAGESVITRAVRVIDAFGPGDSSLGVSEIARRADLPLATAHRIVGELIAEGVLDRDRKKQIRMGTRLWEIAQRSSSVLGLREAALPVMEDLQAIVRSHVQLAVISEGEVLYLERLSRRGAVVNVAKIASRIPSYVCSSGLVLLAYAPEEVQQAVAAGELQRPAERSIGSAAQLRRVLAQVRKQGYSLAPGLLQPTARGVAVPISDSMDRVVAALSIVIPLESDYRRYIPAMLASARAISRGLGMHHNLGADIWHQRNPDPPDSAQRKIPSGQPVVDA